MLDGQARGWGPHVPDTVDDDEESVMGDEETDGNRHGQWQGADEYKSTNNLLHELHTLNQHRLLFSSPQQHLAGIRSSDSSRHLPNPFYPDQAQRTSERPRSHIDHSNIQASKFDAMTSKAVFELPMDEIQRVKGRYEDANKLLRSLFLSRRRELGEVIP